MQIQIVECVAWDQIVSISDRVRSEIYFWSSFFTNTSVQAPMMASEPPAHALSLFTDASGSGGGGFIEGVQGSECSFLRSTMDAATSSTGGPRVYSVLV